ncbi:alpha-amylase MalA [Haloarcula sediminis]|uniref:alpha-amylase MalA n=1 Tax=Haloarcula sediminis TaxID=3111777 RepID=UPI002D7992EA|nr:alpha-amylase MalA [Haloarcula sp. CK38]
MHHPGPPRFVAAGDEIELAPRDPDPTASYRWQLVQLPEDSNTAVGDDPVEQLVPDVPGTYVAELTAPDGPHRLTVRAFPSELSPAGVAGSSGVSGRRSGQVSGGISGGRSGGVSGSGSYGELGTREKGEGGRPRLTLTPVVEGDDAVVRADPQPHPNATETADDLAVEFLLDDRDDVDPGAVTVGERELRVPIEAVGDRLRVHAVAVGEDGYSVADAAEFERDEEPLATDGGTAVQTGGTVTASQPYHPPEWAEESVIYEIYIRTFGGDEGEAFDAIVDRLDYIESLGVDTIWLTPVLQNDHAPHGYNIVDFLSIADDLGTREDYERFIDAAHDRGIKVLFDLVCNHSARTHPHFQAAVNDKSSEYRDWYEWRGDTEPETYFEWEHIANFNFDHLPVRRYLLDAVEKWQPLVDGFRCDMAWAVPNNFWREIHDYCNEADDDFLLLDETIPYIADFQAGLFDMHFDSTLYFSLRQVGNGEDAETVLDAIDEREEAGFPDHASFMVYAENHDETRYIVDYGREAAEAAAAATFTLPGAPMIYAGQEFGQRGRRDELAWDHADDELREYFGSLADVRKGTAALSTDGEVRRVDYTVEDGWDDRVVAYARATADEAVVVVLNFGEEPATVSVPEEAADRDIIADENVGADGGAVTVDSAVVLPADSLVR